MSQSFPIFDADGHVTESIEQVSKYLDDRYRSRPLTLGLYPLDGWDRRLFGTLGDWAGNATSWLEALDKGGMETTVLYPTLGLFLSFLKDRHWAVAICKAYNTFLHEEFVRVSRASRRWPSCPCTTRKPPRSSCGVACASLGSGPSQIQRTKVSTETASTTGTKMPATLSARP